MTKDSIAQFHPKGTRHLFATVFIISLSFLYQPTRADAQCGENSPFPDAAALGGGWNFIEWFGFYNDTFCPWIFHNEHQWLYLAEESAPTGIFYFDLEMGWIFTSSDVYPFLYSFDRQGWLFYVRDSSNPRFFFDAVTEELITVPPPTGGPVLNFTNPGPGGGSFIMSIAIHPTNPDLAYLGGDIEGPFLTTDGGTSYSRVTGNLAGGNFKADVYASQALLFDPNNSNRIYMASWGGLFRSDDAGVKWERLALDAAPDFDAASVASVAVSPADSNIILAGLGDVETNGDGLSAIFRSSDGGSSFSNVTPALFAGEEITVHTLLFDPLNPANVYAATGEGILKSVDAGQTWAFKNSGLPNGTAGAPVAHGLVGIDNSGVFTLFATLRTQSATEFIAGGVFRSVDGGENWADITGNLPRVQDPDEELLSYSYWRIAVDPSNPSSLFVGTMPKAAFVDMGLYKTTNALADAAGVTWDFLWGEQNFTDFGWLEPGWWNELHPSFLAIAPSNPNILFSGSDHVYKSVDGGVTWSEAYAAKVPGAVNTWIGRGIEEMEPFDIAIDPNNDDRWWVGYDDMGLWRTDDGGVSFVRMDDVQESPKLGNSDCACFVETDPTDSNIVYVGRNQGENDFDINWEFGTVWKTVDSGQTWNQLGADLFAGKSGQGGRPFLLLLPGGADVNSRTLFAAIYGQGLFKSTDSGNSWSASDSGISAADREHLWTMAFAPANTNILYAGITDGSISDGLKDGGVYKSSDGGSSWSKLTGPTAPVGLVIDLAVAGDGAVYAASAANFTVAVDGTGNRKGGLYRSADGGATWTIVLDNLRADYVDVAKGNPRFVIAGVSSLFDFNETLDAGVFISRDSGLTFTKEMNGLTHTRLWVVKFHDRDDNTVFVGTGGGGLFVGTGVTQ